MGVIKIIFVSIVIFIIAFSISGLAVLTPSDPLFDFWDENNPQGNNWGQEFIKLPSAWDFTT